MKEGPFYHCVCDQCKRRELLCSPLQLRYDVDKEIVDKMGWLIRSLEGKGYRQLHFCSSSCEKLYRRENGVRLKDGWMWYWMDKLVGRKNRRKMKRKKK